MSAPKNLNHLPVIDLECIESIVDSALAAGKPVSVYDGEEYPLERSTDRAAILDALASTDHDRLYFHNAGETKAFGWAYLVYGNEPGVILSDYTTDEGTEFIVAKANKLADEFED